MRTLRLPAEHKEAPHLLWGFFTVERIANGRMFRRRSSSPAGVPPCFHFALDPVDWPQHFLRLQARIEDIFAGDDKVAVRLRFRGTHSGEFLGFAATGRAVEYVSHEFYRVADGLIAKEWICSDMATLLRQLS